MNKIYFKQLWTLCLPDARPVPPVDDPQDLVADQGMFFQTRKDAEIAAQHQMDLYGVECEVRRISMEVES